MELHLNNLKAFKRLLSNHKGGDVWCVWGAIIKDSKRKFLHDFLFGNEDKDIKGLLSLFDETYHFKPYKAAAKYYPRHPLLMGYLEKLENLEKTEELKSLTNEINRIIKK